MGFPRRPRAVPHQKAASSSESASTATQSESLVLPAAKRRKLADAIFNPELTKIYVVHAKLTPDEISDLCKAIEGNGGKCVTRFDEATIVVSNTRVWHRLQKYLPPTGYELKKFVTPEWVRDSVAAGTQLSFEDKYLIPITAVEELVRRSRLDTGTASASPDPEDLASRNRTATPDSEPDLESKSIINEVSQQSPVYPTLGTSTWHTSRTSPPRWQNKRYACQRWHPLVCINQDLLLELRHIRDHYKLEGDERRQMTYSKAMAAIKAYPYPLKTVKEAQAISGVGEKIAKQCGEYVTTGKIFAADQVKNTQRQKTLLEFTKIHGVGSKMSKELYDKYGCRSLSDVIEYVHLLPAMGENSIRLVDDFDKKIPRAEVDEIAGIINDHLQVLLPGAEYTIVGGYRRGKAESNDVDLLFTHEDNGKEKDVLEALVKRLQEAGIITEILYLALTDSKRDANMKHFHASHMDPLDKAFAVWKSPANGTTRPEAVHRRVDILAVPRKYYACAILGWSGSTTFERDLRLYADKVKNMKFDSGGLTCRATSREILADTEEEIFEILGLEYIPPEWRNCDV